MIFAICLADGPETRTYIQFQPPTHTRPKLYAGNSPWPPTVLPLSVFVVHPLSAVRRNSRRQRRRVDRKYWDAVHLYFFFTTYMIPDRKSFKPTFSQPASRHPPFQIDPPLPFQALATPHQSIQRDDEGQTSVQLGAH